VTEDPDAKDPAGCGCAVGGPADPRGVGLLAVGLAVVAGRRRYKKS
jgi:MYXO-CTERM domain-containing protein